MRYSLTTVTPPASDPVSLAEAKEYLRVDNTAENDTITAMIKQATDMMEQFLRRALINRTLKLTFDSAPVLRSSAWWSGTRDGAISDLRRINPFIILPFPPLVSVTSVKYYDTTDTERTFSADAYFADTEGARVVLKQGYSWPAPVRSQNSYAVTYVAGYGETAASLPPQIVGALKALIAHLYENRDCPGLPENVARFARPYRVLDQIANGANNDVRW